MLDAHGVAQAALSIVCLPTTEVVKFDVLFFWSVGQGTALSQKMWPPCEILVLRCGVCHVDFDMQQVEQEMNSGCV